MPTPNQTQSHKARKNKPVIFPKVPDKVYFTMSEASSLCLVKPYVIRFWEQEFPQIIPAKRRCNRRYYQNEQILLIRKIRSLLYQDGFTIDGARNQLAANKEQKAGAPKTDEEGLAKIKNQVPELQINQQKETNLSLNVGLDLEEKFNLERAIEEKCVLFKDKTLLKEIAVNIEEILSVLEAEVR